MRRQIRAPDRGDQVRGHKLSEKSCRIGGDLQPAGGNLAALGGAPYKQYLLAKTPVARASSSISPKLVTNPLILYTFSRVYT